MFFSLIAASNIPSHNVQSHIYPQSQPQFVSSYVPHMGPAGNFYHVAAPHLTPSVYFGNFTASVNVHGYTQAMQQPYMQANFVPTDNHPSGVEQVSAMFRENWAIGDSIQNIFIFQNTHPIQSQPPSHFTGSRRPRGGDRRGGRSYRREYTSTRQINSVQELNPAQTPTHAIDSSAMMQQSSNFGPYYVNPLQYGIYPNHFTIGPHSTTAAQHATGTPLYGFGYPYHQGIIYPAVMPVDYVLDEKSDDGMGVRTVWNLYRRKHDINEMNSNKLAGTTAGLSSGTS